MSHILLIHQAFVTPNEPGGTRHFEMAAQLRDYGHNLTIVASDLSYLTGQRTIQQKGLVVEQVLSGIRVLRAFTYPSLHLSYTWRIVSFMSFFLSALWASLKAGHVDLVMGTSPPMPQSVSAWLAAVVRRRPFMLEIRDLWPEFAIDMGVLKNPTLIRFAYWLEAFLYQRATHIVVNSPAYRDYMLQRGIPAAKVTLIPNGVDPDMFLPEEDGHTVREFFGLQDKFIVTYAGALGFANDISTILRAAKHLRDTSNIVLLIVGDGKERDQLEHTARLEGLTNVIFAGAQPKSEMPLVLAASDVCVATLKDIPMFKTTYPNKVFDYMAAGRPTILAIDGVIRDVIEAANGGIYVPPGNDLALADAIRKLHHDQMLAREMGCSARNYVVKHFNRRDHARQFADLIEQLAPAK
jgi:glycosyltransferase involved in cell wall biosynthesis